jgi:hypothetical protein
MWKSIWNEIYPLCFERTWVRNVATSC